MLAAVGGALLEFFSMTLGRGGLVLVAAIAYLGTFLLAERRSGGGAIPASVAPETG